MSLLRLVQDVTYTVTHMATHFANTLYTYAVKKAVDARQTTIGTLAYAGIEEAVAYIQRCMKARPIKKPIAGGFENKLWLVTCEDGKKVLRTPRETKSYAEFQRIALITMHAGNTKIPESRESIAPYLYEVCMATQSMNLEYIDAAAWPTFVENRAP
ncbi:MAG TPA: hypothetical protein VN457_08300, partial [Chlamydiales bacterium]|nr:hypothetical protein [Chlamydiales bacterium]